MLNEDGYGVFGTRLNALFDSHRPRLTNAQACEALRRQGYPISLPYLSQLRSGVRRAPSAQVIHALAVLFDVPPDYFYDLRYGLESDQGKRDDARYIERLSLEGPRRLLGITNGLSPASQEVLVKMADHLRNAEDANIRRRRRGLPLHRPEAI
ncbi:MULTISPECIES: transcriptional regulator [Rhodococcus]|uniref:transcriptional regulator n=1 Tax=Rhodococcus TaxID=1827 RepID=UPI00295503D2|nr:transcriptional regulator [Rhodococcus sp. IEGM 1241]MDV8009822.1 transcriptional regulator [Rhodococcus sp. IEGM 1241]